MAISGLAILSLKNRVELRLQRVRQVLHAHPGPGFWRETQDTREAQNVVQEEDVSEMRDVRGFPLLRYNLMQLGY